MARSVPATRNSPPPNSISASAAVEQRVAVALEQPDPVVGHAEGGPEYLGIGALVALAVVLRAGEEGDPAVGLEAEAAHLLAGRGGRLEIAGDAEAADEAARAALGPARREAGSVGSVQRRVENRFEFALAIDLAGNRRVGQLVGAQQVYPAEFRRVPAGLQGGPVDQPVGEQVAVRPPGAAIGSDRILVGQHAAHVHERRRNAVERGAVLEDVGRARQRPDAGDEGAHIGDTGEAHGEDAAVRVERQFAVGMDVPARRVAEEAVGAVVAPAHREAGQPRRDQAQHMFRIGAALHAEGTADIRHQNAHVPGLAADQFGEAARQPEDALPAGMERVAAGFRIPQPGAAARLHRDDRDALAGDAHPRHMGRTGEGCRRRRFVAADPVERDIAGHAVMDERRAGLRRLPRIEQDG